MNEVVQMIVGVLCWPAYLPGVKSSSDSPVHRGLLNVVEKAHRDDSLRAALLQLTQPACSCSQAKSCLVSCLTNTV